MWKAARMLGKWGAIILAVAIAPLFAYGMLGPADGNPIGLGLLFLAGGSIAIPMLAAAGLCALIATVRETLAE